MPRVIVFRLNGCGVKVARVVCRSPRIRFRREDDVDRVLRQIDAELLRASAVDLEDLDVEHDLRLGVVVLLDDALDDLDDVGAGANGDRVVRLVCDDLRGHGESRDTDDAVQDLRDLGGVRMGDEERANDLLFVQRALLRVVRDDHDGALVDDLVEQLIRRENLVERLLERDAAHLHGVGAV